MKFSIMDTANFREGMAKRGTAPTVGQVWKAFWFATLAVGLLLVAVAISSMALAAFSVALMGVAFTMVLPTGDAK